MRTSRKKLLPLLLGVLFLFSLFPLIPDSYAVSVNFSIQCTPQNSAPSGTFTLSGSSVAPGTVACDGSAHHGFTATSGGTVTITVPSDTSTTRYRFNSTTTTENFNAANQTFIFYAYYQLNNTFQATCNGCGNFNASGFTIPVTGTVSGTASSAVVSISLANVANSLSAAGWSDYSKVATFPNVSTPAGAKERFVTWFPSPPTISSNNTASITTGGNTIVELYKKQWNNTFAYSLVGGGAIGTVSTKCVQVGRNGVNTTLTTTPQGLWCDDQQNIVSAPSLFTISSTEQIALAPSKLNNNQPPLVVQVLSGGSNYVFHYYHQYILIYQANTGGCQTQAMQNGTAGITIANDSYYDSDATLNVGCIGYGAFPGISQPSYVNVMTQGQLNGVKILTNQSITSFSQNMTSAKYSCSKCNTTLYLPNTATSLSDFIDSSTKKTSWTFNSPYNYVIGVISGSNTELDFNVPNSNLFGAGGGGSGGGGGGAPLVVVVTTTATPQNLFGLIPTITLPSIDQLTLNLVGLVLVGGLFAAVGFVAVRSAHKGLITPKKSNVRQGVVKPRTRVKYGEVNPKKTRSIGNWQFTRQGIQRKRIIHKK